MVKVFGLSIGLVLVFIMVITRNFTIIEILKIGGMVGSFIGILLLFSIGVVMGNKVHYSYIITEEGIIQGMGEAEKKRNRAIIGLSMLSGSIRSTGAALLAASRETISLSWDEVKKINRDEKRNFIKLMDGWHTIMLLYCKPENYREVEKILEKYVSKI
ncbi:hypothetical protein GF319_01005 [Candidatus Bathyarchaeota archaeon]|nr:hypothetical protein [Candidatus Bathyarchaeota archaeon]